MPRTPQSAQLSTKALSATTNQMIAASDERPFDPTRSKAEGKIFDDAAEDNRQRDFVHNIMEARKPVEVPVHVPPPISPQLAEQTRLEMEAGAARVAEFASQELSRQEVTERNKRDKWSDPGSVAVFRPDDYVPDQKKAQGNVKATSQPIV